MPSNAQRSFPSAPLSIEDKIHSFVHFTELGSGDIRQEFYSSLLVECQKRSFFPKVIKIKDDQAPKAKTEGYFPAAVTKQVISWDEFRKGKKTPLQSIMKNEEMKTMTIFDIHPQATKNFQDFIPLIDHWVFAIEPEIEQLNEFYRMIKGTRVLNNHLKYYLLFKTNREDLSVSFLKDGINCLLEKHLKCEAFDLGSWGTRGVSVAVHWGTFFEAQESFQDEYSDQKDSFLYYIEHGQSLEQRAI
jgi:hypothetical protein